MVQDLLEVLDHVFPIASRVEILESQIEKLFPIVSSELHGTLVDVNDDPSGGVEDEDRLDPLFERDSVKPTRRDRPLWIAVFSREMLDLGIRHLLLQSDASPEEGGWETLQDI